MTPDVWRVELFDWVTLASVTAGVMLAVAAAITWARQRD
jgi:hypothetical protein